jgi:hypothetical protein
MKPAPTNPKSAINFCTMITATFRALLIIIILLILIHAIPWLFPTATITQPILGMQEIFSYITRSHNNVTIFMSTLSPMSRIFGLLGSIVRLLPLLFGIIIMISLSKDYSLGKVFNLDNAKRYKNLGILFLANALIIQPMAQMLFNLCATINNPIGKRLIGFGVDLSTVTNIFFAAILIIIGHVMKLAYDVNEEQKLTV